MKVKLFTTEKELRITNNKPIISQLIKRTLLLTLTTLGATQTFTTTSNTIESRKLIKKHKPLSPPLKRQQKQQINLSHLKQAPETVKNGPNPFFPFDPIRGYIDIYDKNNSMWYWLVRARHNHSTAPLIIFLEGGPGGASSEDFTGASGPLTFRNYSNSHPKAYLKGSTSWAEKANLLYPDFPLGVGFSTVTSEYLSYDGKQAQEQILLFFEKFLEIFPEFKNRPIFVAGISYGGHWVPYTAYALKYAQNPDINVKGFYISSGLIDYQKAVDSYISFALANFKYTGFTEADATPWKKVISLCQHMGRLCPKHPLLTVDRYKVCEDKGFLAMMAEIRQKKPKFNNKDISGDFHFDLSNIEFLNNSQVINFLKVRKRHFEPINMTFFYFFAPKDGFVPMQPLLARLLDDGVKGVVAAGRLDFICNYMQSEAAVASIGWKWREEYNRVKMGVCPPGGLCKEFKNLREYRVDGSGHGIGYFRPEVAAEIINSLIDWEPYL